MTIAAGFKFDGGILLCADSQFSRGRFIKTKGEKIMSGAFKRLPVKLGFAMAGDIPKARAAMRNILIGIDALPASASPTDIFKAIEDAMEKSYRSVFRHPKFKSGEGPDFWLLMCLHMDGQGSSLLITEEDTVNEVPQYECTGSGNYLFRYIIDDVYTPTMELQQLVTLLTYAMKEIKIYDPNVGFDSEFMTFFNKDRSFSKVAAYDVEHMENFGSLTKREFFEYMFVMADLRSSDSEISQARQEFDKKLVSIRRKYEAHKRATLDIQNLLAVLATTDKGLTFEYSRQFTTKTSVSRKSKRGQ